MDDKYYCSHCGAEITNYDTTCWSCGYHLITSDEEAQELMARNEYDGNAVALDAESRAIVEGTLQNIRRNQGVRCTICDSTNIQVFSDKRYSLSNGILGGLAFGAVGLLAGAVLPRHEDKGICMDCGYKLYV